MITKNDEMYRETSIDILNFIINNYDKEKLKPNYVPFAPKSKSCVTPEKKDMIPPSPVSQFDGNGSEGDKEKNPFKLSEEDVEIKTLRKKYRENPEKVIIKKIRALKTDKKMKRRKIKGKTSRK